MIQGLVGAALARRRSAGLRGRVAHTRPRHRSEVRFQPLIERRRRVDADGRNDRHSRTERDVGRRIVQDDLDRHALDDLDVVAGRVFGRQQREGRAGAGLDAIEMAVEVAFRVGVDLQVDRLPRPHAVELRLLVVRHHPDLVGHEHRKVRARLRILADGAGEVDDAAGLVGGDGRIGEVELGLVELGLRLGEASPPARCAAPSACRFAAAPLSARLARCRRWPAGL